MKFHPCFKFTSVYFYYYCIIHTFRKFGRQTKVRFFRSLAFSFRQIGMLFFQFSFAIWICLRTTFISRKWMLGMSRNFTHGSPQTWGTISTSIGHRSSWFGSNFSFVSAWTRQLACDPWKNGLLKIWSFDTNFITYFCLDSITCSPVMITFGGSSAFRLSFWFVGKLN